MDADVHEHRRAAGSELRQFFVHEPADADALEPDCIQHSRRGLDDARGRMTLAFLQEQALDDDAAERREVHDVRILDAVAETSARRDQRVPEGESADPSREIHIRPKRSW